TIDDEVHRQSTRNRLRFHVPTNKDVFCYVYTSGTTGLPKAAVIRNQRMLGANLVFGHLMHRSGPGDVIYVPLPLFHSNALFLGWGSALATGAAIALKRKFSVSSFWSDILEYRATSFVYIGELCRYLLQAPVRPEETRHHLEVAVGNGLRPEIWERFQKRFAIPAIREFYGSTEGNAPTLNWRGRPGLIGRKLRNQAVIRCDAESGEVVRDATGFCTRVSVGDSGLLVGRISPLLTFDGYVDAKATEQKILTDVFKRGDRYFNTGDLVELHAYGWLSFLDRLGDTYRWKGENVSTQEVAEILHRAPGVLDANVFGVSMPHADGRAGMAALRVHGRFSPGGLAHYVRDHLAVAQRPLFVRVLRDEMQVTSTLKPKKGEYRAQGYDLKQVRDPVYVLRGGRYVRLTPKLVAGLTAGAWQPG
ncbi:MAG: long-chain-acyl-CoA synthetase, partial [Deltaproteobacteria bacterium]|nr:long-chain-acyl-CoA synthetase [Deltaproteobacteria bacterium]